MSRRSSWPASPTPPSRKTSISGPASASRTSQSQNSAATNSRSSRLVTEPLPPEKDPLWYAQQLAALSAEFDATSIKEERLRQFRTTGSAPGVRIGLQLNAPCEGITTDNEIAQLAIRRLARLNAIPFDFDGERSWLEQAVARAEIIADHAVNDKRSIHLTRSGENLSAGKVSPLVAGDDAGGLEPLVVRIELGADIGSRCRGSADIACAPHFFDHLL